MKVFTNSVATMTCVILLPLSVLAAPTPESTLNNYLDQALSPHMSCLAGGQKIQDLSGEWNNINATVAAGCAHFASYTGHTFEVGDKVRIPYPLPPDTLSSFQSANVFPPL